MTVNLDKVRLAKILSRTQSDSAGEVFAAMTIANRMLREANTSWDILLVGKANPRSKAGVVRGGTATPPPWAKGAVSMGVREQIEYLLSSKTLASATRISAAAGAEMKPVAASSASTISSIRDALRTD